ncbi:MAG: pantoate--beta-alanine ligase [Terrimicrobiaceae bacterium]
MKRETGGAGAGLRVFVPTMGALHDGHAALIRRARKLATSRGTVVVSLFVNPTQFGPGEDFAKYPRQISRDLEICRSSGADLVFAPSVEEMYGNGPTTVIEETEVAGPLCGRSRPGHFRGVCTVVGKLFHLVAPTHALFGEKDWQQVAVIRRMISDLDFPVRIVTHPTVREKDGLAKSSRNSYLSPEERRVAPGIVKAMRRAVRENRSPEAIVRQAFQEICLIPGARIDYVEAVEADTLQPLKSRKKNGRLAVAVFLGRTRLIDNIPVPTIRSRR